MEKFNFDFSQTSVKKRTEFDTAIDPAAVISHLNNNRDQTPPRSLKSTTVQLRTVTPPRSPSADPFDSTQKVNQT